MFLARYCSSCFTLVYLFLFFIYIHYLLYISLNNVVEGILIYTIYISIPYIYSILVLH